MSTRRSTIAVRLAAALLIFATRGARAESAPGAAVSVPFNHVFLVLSAESFDALAGTSEWRGLANVEQRTTLADGVSWTGLYLYLDNGYLELLRDGAAGMKAGAIGLAVSVERLAELDAAGEALEPLLPSLQRATRNKQEGDLSTPWFDMLFSTAGEAGIGIPFWVMAYRPELFRAKGHDVADGAAITVRDFARLAPQSQDPAKCDRVRTIRLALAPESAAGLGRALAALGWSAKRALTAVDYSQAGVKISLIPGNRESVPRLVDITWNCATKVLKDSSPAPGVQVTEHEGSVTWQFR